MTAPAIKIIRAQEILDSRGTPTVEVTVCLADGTAARASVPEGASTGVHEAKELRDRNAARFGGNGVLRACRTVMDVIGPRLQGMSAADQESIDSAMNELDGTEDKSRLGANAILGVSLACARVAAKSAGVPLYRYLHDVFGGGATRPRMPAPMLNFINGAKHADNGLDFQEYLVIPKADRFADQLRIAAEVYRHLGALLRSKKKSTMVGDEGGFAPHCATNREPLAMMQSAVLAAGYASGTDVQFGIDAAASEFWNPKTKRYDLTREQRSCTATQLVAYYHQLVQEFPIVSLEDGCAEDDWSGWKKLTQFFGSTVRIIGDDVFVTNVHRLQRGITEGVANAILIKPNQVGTLTETFAAIRLARTHGYTVCISHRSGETTDAFIADLAVGVQAPFIKAGAVARGERLAKYNRLLEIEAELG